MSKKIVKIIICTILINFLFLSIYSQASNQNIDDIFGVGQQFINTGEGGNIHFMDNQVINSVQDVGGLFSTIGTIIIVCVVFLSVLKRKKKAIKYIEDSKFSIIEEISFSQSSEIIMWKFAKLNYR